MYFFKKKDQIDIKKNYNLQLFENKEDNKITIKKYMFSLWPNKIKRHSWIHEYHSWFYTKNIDDMKRK